jgi:DNA-binding XRE family transcriptional regulator
MDDPVDEVALIAAAFSNRIRARRLELNLTQAELAGISGLSVRTIGHIENQCKSAFHNVVSVLRALNLEHLFAELEISAPLRLRASRQKD